MSDEITIAKFLAVAGLAMCVCSILFTPSQYDGQSPAFTATVGFLTFLGALGYLAFKRR